MRPASPRRLNKKHFVITRPKSGNNRKKRPRCQFKRDQRPLVLIAQLSGGASRPEVLMTTRPCPTSARHRSGALWPPDRLRVAKTILNYPVTKEKFDVPRDERRAQAPWDIRRRRRGGRGCPASASLVAMLSIFRPTARTSYKVRLRKMLSNKAISVVRPTLWRLRPRGRDTDAMGRDGKAASGRGETKYLTP